MDIQEILQKDLSDALGLSEMDEQEKRVFFDEVGTLVVESALLKYMVPLPEAEQLAFEEWVEKNAESESFLADLAVAYPDFEQVLLEEIAAYKTEVGAALGEV